MYSFVKPLLLLCVLVPWVRAGLLGLGGKPLSWEYCDKDADYLLKIDHIKVSPDPPKRGAKLSIQAKAELKAEIAKGATLTYTVKLGLIQLAKDTVDLCGALKDLKDNKLQCPMPAGKIEVSRQESMPDTVPAGKYTIEARAVTADKKQIVCVKAEVALPLIED